MYGIPQKMEKMEQMALALIAKKICKERRKSKKRRKLKEK